MPDQAYKTAYITTHPPDHPSSVALHPAPRVTVFSLVELQRRHIQHHISVCKHTRSPQTTPNFQGSYHYDNFSIIHSRTSQSASDSRPAAAMAERNLSQIVAQLKHSPSMSYPDANALLSKAKLALLSLNALTPSTTPSASSSLLALARETYEQGALFAIRARSPEAFTRYVQQLQPFYELPSAVLPPNLPERNKVTGLSLLLLLTQGRYAEFHSELESLANREGGGGDVEGDRYLGYPIRLERWLMEGSYDRVWKAMKSSEVPCDEYSVFSEVLYMYIPDL